MNRLTVTDISSLTEEEREGHIRRRMPSNVSDDVRSIIEEVKKDGDAALYRFAKKYDGIELSSLRVEVASEYDLDKDLKHSLDTLIDRTRAHHLRQGGVCSWQQEIHPGIKTGERTLALGSVALYVPGGKGRFPSVMVMLGVPSVIAGVERIVVCSPPGEAGPDPATLYVASRLGIEEFYAVGGAGAIAALALGNTSLPKVDKVIGPGNNYVTEAKKQLSHLIDPGPLAGPSESLVIADGSADHVSVAREMLVEAEHGPDSRVVLLTDSSELAGEVARVLPHLVESLDKTRRDYASSVFSKESIFYHQDIKEIIRFSNQFAPEHLRIMTSRDQEIYQEIKNAGEALLGPYSSIALGNYSAGVNSVLPTSSLARSVSCLGVNDFCKINSYVEISKKASREIAAEASILADYEGFPAHSRAARDLLPD